MFICSHTSSSCLHFCSILCDFIHYVCTADVYVIMHLTFLLNFKRNNYIYHLVCNIQLFPYMASNQDLKKHCFTSIPNFSCFFCSIFVSCVTHVCSTFDPYLDQSSTRTPHINPHIPICSICVPPWVYSKDLSYSLMNNWIHPPIIILVWIRHYCSTFYKLFFLCALI